MFCSQLKRSLNQLPKVSALYLAWREFVVFHDLFGFQIGKFTINIENNSFMLFCQNQNFHFLSYVCYRPGKRPGIWPFRPADGVDKIICPLSPKRKRVSSILFPNKNHFPSVSENYGLLRVLCNLPFITKVSSSFTCNTVNSQRLQGFVMSFLTGPKAGPMRWSPWPQNVVSLQFQGFFGSVRLFQGVDAAFNFNHDQ